MQDRSNLIKVILILSFLYIIVNCSSNSRIMPYHLTRDTRIAVMDFDQEGFLGGEKLGSFAADELTSQLFLKQKLRVIDRIQVKAEMQKKGISLSLFDKESIRKLGRFLNADFLILGKIVQLNSNNFYTQDNSYFLQITFRIISTEDGSVVGIVTRRETGNKKPRIIVGGMLKEMVKKVNLKSGELVETNGSN